MSGDNRKLRDQALVMHRAMDVSRGGMAAKVLAHASGVPEATLRSYARADAPAAMPLAVFAALCGVLDDAALSALLPEGFALVRLDGHADHDGLAAGCIDFAGAHARARHPESEQGVAIGPLEDRDLSARGARLRAAPG